MPGSVHLPPWFWPALVGLLVLLWWAASTRTRRANMARGRRARRAESAAERLLVSRGYRIEDRQVTRTFDVDVDGAPIEVWCRADLLVRHRRRRYVAEVKAGRAHADPTHPHTRRQLLEYRLAFDVDGVLLVDMVHHRIVEVAFPWLARR